MNRVRGCIKIRTEKVSTNVIGEPTTYESLEGYSRSIRAKSTVQCNDTLDILYAWYIYEYCVYIHGHMSFVISFRVHRNLTYDRDIG